MYAQANGLMGQQNPYQQAVQWPPFNMVAQSHNHYVVFSPVDRVLLERLVAAIEAAAVIRSPRKREKAGYRSRPVDDGSRRGKVGKAPRGRSAAR